METSDKIISIICLTYNHVPYIKQCLDGFLMQESTFPIEIIIHDDASTDGTQDILLEYQKKYPHLFHLILQAENQYSKGVNIFLDYLIPQIKGKYIALCEGDDYWTDPYKLQKQISFLEKYPSYSICCHHIKLFNQQNGVFEEHCIPNKFRDRNFTFNGQLWMEYTPSSQVPNSIGWHIGTPKEATCFIMLNSDCFVSCCAISETRKRYCVPFSSVTQYFLSLDQPLFIGSFVTKFISFLRSSICQTP